MVDEVELEPRESAASFNLFDGVDWEEEVKKFKRGEALRYEHGDISVSEELCIAGLWGAGTTGGFDSGALNRHCGAYYPSTSLSHAFVGADGTGLEFGVFHSLTSVSECDSTAVSEYHPGLLTHSPHNGTHSSLWGDHSTSTPVQRMFIASGGTTF